MHWGQGHPPGGAENPVPALLFFTVLYAVLAAPVLSEGGLPPAMLAASAVLAVALVALSAIDLRAGRLPDAITLPMVLTGPAAAWVFGWDSPVWRIGAAAAGFLFLYGVALSYRRIRGRDGLGLGDAKLLAAAGAWLGFQGLPAVMLWATGTALAAAAAAALLGHRITGASRMPFGPFLALGFWLVWLYGPLS